VHGFSTLFPQVTKLVERFLCFFWLFTVDNILPLGSFIMAVYDFTEKLSRFGPTHRAQSYSLFNYSLLGITLSKPEGEFNHLTFL
jgi:hypothetical protein